MNEAPTLPIAPGQVIGERYRVGQLLGEGGMGVVCEAMHLGLEVPVAIKFIRTDLKDNTEFVQRFLNEARRAAVLKNEHVARVHDVGQLDSGDLYLVMERLNGVGLETHLRQHGPLSPAEAVDLVREACEGLSEAHAAGIVHRDIKPENLFLARRLDGKRILKILDFGISKQTTEDAPTSLTNSERSLGSPWYMSPEQMIDTSSVDHRADIWSLGVVLFELLTATRPFEGGSIPEVCAGVLTAPAPSLRERRPEVSPALESIVARCLSKSPEERPASVLELSKELEPFAASSDTAPPSAGSRAEEAFFKAPDEPTGRETPISLVPPRAPSPRATLARTLAAIGILASIALAIGAFAAARRGRNEQPPPSPIPSPAPVEPSGVDIQPPMPSTPPPAVVPMPPSAAPSSLVPPPPAGSDVEAGATQPAPSAEAPGATRKPPAAAEPSLTPEEIRRRKQRYERWLREQGLQRLDDVKAPRQPEGSGEQGAN